MIPVILVAGMTFPYWSFITTEALATTTNMMVNPSVETGATMPDSWSQGEFGTNVTNFSYPTTAGFDGTRAVRVDMTSYESGDAKWYPADVPVTPGTTYVFSDLSQSDVPTGIDVRYKMISSGNSTDTNDTATNTRHRIYDNFHWDRASNEWKPDAPKWQYIHLGDVPAESAPTLHQFTFTVPLNTTSLTVFHYIDSVGYLITDNYSLMEEGGIIAPDSIAPVVAITDPVGGTTVLSTSTPVSVNATDTVAVVGVKLMLDDTTIIGTEMTIAPYNFVWDTTNTSNGTHTLSAVARDATGNRGTSTPVSITVSN